MSFKLKILITGSSGEIGTNLALRLKSEGHEVFGIDKRKNTWTDEFEYILLDLSQKFTNFDKGFDNTEIPFRPDVVVHLAANAKVHELVKHPTRAFDNTQITLNVLEYCRQNNLPIIFSSSREVYGDIKRFRTEEDSINVYFTESPYSASKIAGEAFIYSYAKCYGLRYIILRFSNVYGRYDWDIDRMERVIPLFIRKIMNSEQITVFGKNKTLDFTFVDDAIDGICRAILKLHSGEIKAETINLAYGEGHTLIEMVDYINQYLGKNITPKVEDSKVGEVTHYVADTTKARKLIGYSPKTPLSEGIRKAIDNFKASKEYKEMSRGDV